MKTAIIELTSAAPMTQSRKHDAPKLERELADAYEQRTWREKAHVDSEGRITIPAFAIKCALVAAAKYSGDQIPGKGKSTWTKKLQSGVIFPEDALTNRTRDDVKPTTINANADGVRGSGKRVTRTFPTIHEWKAQISAIVVDEIITRDVLERYLTMAGQFIGVGQYRPENGGVNGRFSVKVISFE
jgi:hypothetical protein